MLLMAPCLWGTDRQCHRLCVIEAEPAHRHLGSSLAVRWGMMLFTSMSASLQLSLLPVYSCTSHHWREKLGVTGGGSTLVTPSGEMVGNGYGSGKNECVRMVVCVGQDVG